MKYFPVLLAGLTVYQVSGQQQYEAAWSSPDRRKTPSWFENARFGSFIHRGLYPVPARVFRLKEALTSETSHSPTNQQLK